MTRFVFADEGVVPFAGSKLTDPQLVGESLEAIAAESKGELRPDAVVTAAREKSHPLHGFFLWDDAEAADLYRREQARTLIRSIRIEPEEPGQEPPRAFHSIADNGRSYRSFNEIAGSVSLQERLMAQADAELESFVRRHARMADICAVIIEAREKLAAKRRAAEEKRAAG